MDPLPGPPIRPLDDVEREHVEATMAVYRGRVPLWRIAAELGIGEKALTRRLRKWEIGESLIRDRR